MRNDVSQVTGASASAFLELLYERFADKFGDKAYIDTARLRTLAEEAATFNFLLADPKVFESCDPDESEYEPDAELLAANPELVHNLGTFLIKMLNFDD